MAVQNLEYNDTKSACEFLTTAVKVILNTSAIFRRSTRPQQENLSIYTHFEWSDATYFELKSSPQNNDPFGTFLFSRAMFVHDRNPTTRPCRRHLSADAKAAIVYNAGLTFHILAIKQNDSRLLSKAGSMYSLSQTILRKAAETGYNSKLCFHSFFHIVLLNNLGQMSYMLVDYDASSHYFGQLELNLRYITSRPKHENTFDSNDMLGMMSNTFVDV
eukprot:CAMPEP_0178910410 /NCGR_PEP_ID=MMETSP0786-20121207/9083_1 /TAXON_ID=186022 /ORGANISM="Thalassionema frauenfeldii, Strain CCMP 1798" /LENGTH=216 /DNA_ID=CAMNT_0020582661 /DNA_START=87 /DNA_END=733 /DNA_ORIENTATION=+